ncbi:MAG: response regulator, partial [Acidobacteriota bacterium]
ATEAPIAGLDVKLFRTDTVPQTFIGTDTTDGLGFYSFDELELGTYRIEVDETQQTVVLLEASNPVPAVLAPVVVITVAVLIVSGIMVWVIPKFQDIFNDFEVQLPGLTVWLINASLWIAGKLEDLPEIENQLAKNLLRLEGRPVPESFRMAAARREMGVSESDRLAVSLSPDGGRVAYSIPHRTFFEADRVISRLTEVPSQALRNAVEQQKVGEKSALAVLEDADFLDTEAARDLAREISITALLEAMEEPELRFRVESSDDRPEEGCSLGFDLDIDELRMERLRRTDAWHVIEHVIPSVDVTMIRSSDSARLSARLSLTPLESKIFDLVDGDRTVRDIVQQINSTAFEVCQVFYRLLGAEVVRLKQRRGEINERQIRRVLVVDSDGEGLCPAVTEILTDLHAGVEIRCQSDSFNRVPYLIKIFQPDTILIEVHLDGFDTTKLVKLLRQSGEFQSLRIIGMSEDLDDAEIRQLYRVGFNGFLPKPFFTEQLTELFADTTSDATQSLQTGDSAGNNT